MTAFMIALWTIWAAFLFGGFLFSREDPEQSHRMPRWTRMASSFTLVIAGWLWFLYAHESLAGFIALGMTLGFIGDLFMAEVIPTPNRVIAGMLAFGFGHVAYIIGLIIASWENSPEQYAVLIGTLLFAVVLWYWVVFRGSHGLMHWLALPYGLLLASTAGFALSAFVATGMGYLLIISIGAVLFLLSDLLLAAQIFNQRDFRYIGDIIWFLYGSGQMLIVFGAVLS